MALNTPEHGPSIALLRRRASLGLLLVFSLTSLSHAQQISPGPLSRAHADLDGPLDCLKCHGTTEESLRDRCLACHPEISWLVANERGLHGQEVATDCVTCHAEHAGADTLMRFPAGGIEQLDHQRTGWPLVGSHSTVQCRGCHKAELQISEAARLSPRKNHETTFIGLEPICAACHLDVHRASLGPDCHKCHNPSEWRATTEFDHQITGYALTGSHRRVDCQKCHPPLKSTPSEGSEGIPRLLLKRPHNECSACHRDVHQGRAGPFCSRCHVTDGFQRIALVSFDHQRTKFPLTGKHMEVRCPACHQSNSRPRALPASTANSPTGDLSAQIRCRECHADVHGGQLVGRPALPGCASCHRSDGWEFIGLAPESHETVHAPLRGRHAAIECAACHGSNRKVAPLPLPSRALGRAGVAFELGDPDCSACHSDPHRGYFSTTGAGAKEKGCLTCHDLDSFRPSTVNPRSHGRFGFPINGAHRNVTCDRCHKEIRPGTEESGLAQAEGEKVSLLFQVDPSCQGCHKGPHGNQFAQRSDGGACGSCHDDSSFRPASRFNHDRDTYFPLLTSHQGVACGECHKKRLEGSENAVVYRPTPFDCKACHRKKVPLKRIG